MILGTQLCYKLFNIIIALKELLCKHLQCTKAYHKCNWRKLGYYCIGWWVFKCFKVFQHWSAYDNAYTSIQGRHGVSKAICDLNQRTLLLLMSHWTTNKKSQHIGKTWLYHQISLFPSIFCLTQQFHGIKLNWTWYFLITQRSSVNENQGHYI